MTDDQKRSKPMLVHDAEHPPRPTRPPHCIPRPLFAGFLVAILLWVLFTMALVLSI